MVHTHDHDPAIALVSRNLPFDEAAAAEHATIRLALLSTPVGERDLVIASVAMANRLIVVTRNRREFARVPGLEIETWH